MNIKLPIYFKFIFICQFCFSLNLTIHEFHNPSASHILDTHVIDDILIVVGMIGGVEFYDISNSSELNHLTNYNLPSGGGGGAKPNCVTNYGNYIYFTGKNGVAIVNISNPNYPEFIGYIPNTGNMILENLDVYDNILSVCAHSDGVFFFDIENPENPILIDNYEVENAWAVELKPSLINDNIVVYIGSNSDLIILEINNNSIQFSNSINYGSAIKDVLIIEQNLYLALGSDGVKAFDIESMQNPILIGEYNTAGMANRLSELNNKVAVSDWDDVEVLEIIGDELQRVAYKNTTRRTMAIATKDNFIYSAEWASVQVFEYGEIAGSDIDLNTYELNYPYVENGNSYTMSLELTNNGNSILEISDIFTTNNEFTISDYTNLSPGESHTLEVIYNANAMNASGGLRIWSNDQDEPDLICETNGNINGANIGDIAPDFELEVVANGEGNYRLSDHLGDVIVLAFFAPN